MLKNDKKCQQIDVFVEQIQNSMRTMARLNMMTLKALG